VSKEKETFKLPKYSVLTSDEVIKLLVCVVFDAIEYVFPVLLTPLVGDVLDVIGIGVGIILFGWLGLFSLFEFVPTVDLLPIFTLTWCIWYFLKKKTEEEQIERLKTKWK
jgi:hypothetical protein